MGSLKKQMTEYTFWMQDAYGANYALTILAENLIEAFSQANMRDDDATAVYLIKTKPMINESSTDQAL